jgi:hypothetical protein
MLAQDYASASVFLNLWHRSNEGTGDLQIGDLLTWDGTTWIAQQAPSSMGGSSGPEFLAGTTGNYTATNAINLNGYEISSWDFTGEPDVFAPSLIKIYGRDGNDGPAGAIEIKGGAGVGSSFNGAAVTLKGGRSDDGGTGGAVLISGGDGPQTGMNDNPGGAVTITGGSGRGGSGSPGGNVTISGGAGPVPGNVNLSLGSGNLVIDATSGNVKVVNGMDEYLGATEDVSLSDGNSGTITLHFVRGIYTGHTGP